MRYLLGTLSEAEREHLEEQYFSDDDKFENIEIAEDEVVDRYVRGKLAPNEVERFKEVLATSPRLVERVKLASILINQIESREQASGIASEAVVDKKAEKPGWWKRWFGSGLQLTPAFRSAMVTAMAVVILAVALLIAGWLNSRRVSNQLAYDKAQTELQIQQLKKQIEEQSARTKQLNADLQTKQDELSAKEKLLEELRTQQLDNSRQTATASVLTPIVLQGGALRSGDSKSDFVLKPNSSAVEITLQLRTNEYPTYNVFMETAERAPVHTARRLRPRNSRTGPTISFRVPAEKVSPKDYIIRLEAGDSNEPLDEYFFRVVPRK